LQRHICCIFLTDLLITGSFSIQLFSAEVLHIALRLVESQLNMVHAFTYTHLQTTSSETLPFNCHHISHTHTTHIHTHHEHTHTHTHTKYTHYTQYICTYTYTNTNSRTHHTYLDTIVTHTHTLTHRHATHIQMHTKSHTHCHTHVLTHHVLEYYAQVNIHSGHTFLTSLAQL